MRLIEGEKWRELGTDLANTCFPDARFVKENMKSFNFKNAVYTEAVFEQVDLTQADFSGTILTKALFYKCDLRHTKFVSAQLTQAVFHDCDLSYSNFEQANLEGCSYPLNCQGFNQVSHSMENIQQFLSLFQLLRGIDHSLLQAITPWFSEDICLPNPLED